MFKKIILYVTTNESKEKKMIRYARCEHCGQKVKVIKKENYDEVEDIIYNLKKDGEEYILEEGPRYSNEIEWKENAYGEIEMCSIVNI